MNRIGKNRIKILEWVSILSAIILISVGCSSGNDKQNLIEDGSKLDIDRSYSGDMDCPDFATQDEAQTYFESHGGSSYNNFDRLDRDGDGIACELN